jgi:addiction module HigA family antidote
MMSEPVSPGEVIRTRVLPQYGLTQDALADALGVSRYSVNQLINGRRNVTTDMALRIAHVTNTSPEFWLNLQRQLDLYETRLKLEAVLPTLPIVSDFIDNLPPTSVSE